MMFERLDADARRAMDVAIAAAHELGHGWLGTEHALIGLLGEREALPQQAARLLPGADAVRHHLLECLGRGSGQKSDRELLAMLGIDLDEVRRRAAARFGEDEVARAGTRARARRLRRRRRRCERPPRCLAIVAGESLRMAPRLKRALDAARRRCEQRGEPAITAPLLLAAVLGVPGGLALELLGWMGVDVARVRALLEAGPPAR
jgi:ATP-dependent Clp protease ATP-binding subunit ClpA